MRIIILGAPGAGKSTFSKKIARKLNLPRIYLGELLRNEVKKGSKLGRQIDPIISKGKLVPHKIVDFILTKRLSKIDCRKGYIIDGFPRKLEEAKWFTKKHHPNKVINIMLDEETAVKRIAKRHNKRTDQLPNIIRNRFKIYHKETEQVIKYFKNKGLLLNINNNQPYNKINKTINSIFEAWK